MITERVELIGSDGLIYGEIVDGVLEISSRQSRRNRTVDVERWNLSGILFQSVATGDVTGDAIGSATGVEGGGDADGGITVAVAVSSRK